MLKFIWTFLALFTPGVILASELLPMGLLLEPDSFQIQELPTGDGFTSALANMRYEDSKKVLTYTADFNGDGKEDYLIRSSQSLCGAGGCSYAMLDGNTKQNIGEFFGNPLLIFEKKINNFPVIQAYSHSNAESGTIVAYVYDGKYYEIVSYVVLSGASVEHLFDSFKSMQRVGKK